uniref:Uncharacterized protein n=1 Tax=Arundo donax TaxID=35708 RepID=A0A0A9EYS5_ARUDO
MKSCREVGFNSFNHLWFPLRQYCQDGHLICVNSEHLPQF